LVSGLPATKHFGVLLDTEIELKCSFQSKPSSTIKWYFNELEISSDNSYDIQNTLSGDISTSVLKKKATTDDTGTYKCEVANDLYTEDKSNSSVSLKTFSKYLNLCPFGYNKIHQKKIDKTTFTCSLFSFPEIGNLSLSIAETTSTSLTVRLNGGNIGLEINAYYVEMKLTNEKSSQIIQQREVNNTKLQTFYNLKPYTTYKVEAQEVFSSENADAVNVQSTTEQAGACIFLFYLIVIRFQPKS